MSFPVIYDTDAIQLAREVFTPPEERHVEKISLYDCVKQAWPLIESVPFIDSWHIGAECEHLEAVTKGQIKNLLINQPPGTLKSTTVSVVWPIWEWMEDPNIRWFFASYDARLSTRDSVRCRALIGTPWYLSHCQKAFTLTGDQNLKTYYETDRGGYRLATSVGGHGAGEHPDRIVVDDPHNVKEAESEAERQSVIEWWTLQMPARGVARNARRVIVMQRLHAADLSGYVLANEDFVHLCLPMRYEPSRMISTPLGWNDPRKEEGELLCPDLFPEPEVKKLEKKLGTYGTAGQLQQRPAPRGGGIFKSDDFRYFRSEMRHTKAIKRPGYPTEYDDELWVVLLNYDQITEFASFRVEECNWYQTSDTAQTDNADSKYTACLTAGITPDRQLLFWDVDRDKLKVPKQYNWVISHRARCPGTLIFQAVEQAASGFGLIQHAAAEGTPFKALMPHGMSKTQRAGSLATMYENHMVYHLQGAPWLVTFEDEMTEWPNGTYTDQGDCAAWAAMLADRDELLRGEYKGDLVTSAKKEESAKGWTHFQVGDTEVVFTDDDELDPWRK